MKYSENKQTRRNNRLQSLNIVICGHCIVRMLSWDENIDMSRMNILKF